jgi:hypothetical protein
MAIDLMGAGPKNLVSSARLALVPTPEPTLTYHPVPHADVSVGITQLLTNRGWNISDLAHHVSDNGLTYFGTCTLTTPHDLSLTVPAGISLDVGWWNAHDRSSSIKMMAGDHISVCTNGCVFGHILGMDRRMHTSMVDDPVHGWKQRMIRVVDRLPAIFTDRFAQIDRYRNHDLASPTEVNSLLVESYRRSIVSGSMLGKIIDEWDTPSFPEFTDRNAWSLFNAFTHIQKQLSPTARITRQPSLVNLFDEWTNDPVATATEILA